MLLHPHRSNGRVLTCAQAPEVLCSHGRGLWEEGEGDPAHRDPLDSDVKERERGLGVISQGLEPDTLSLRLFPQELDAEALVCDRDLHNTMKTKAGFRFT